MGEWVCVSTSVCVGVSAFNWMAATALDKSTRFAAWLLAIAPMSLSLSMSMSQLKPDDELAPASCDWTFALRLSAGHFQLTPPSTLLCLSIWPERLGSARLLLVIRVRPPRSHILLSCTHSDCLHKVASFILYKHWKLFSFSLQLALPLPLPPSGFFSFHSFGFLLPSPP